MRRFAKLIRAFLLPARSGASHIARCSWMSRCVCAMRGCRFLAARRLAEGPRFVCFRLPTFELVWRLVLRAHRLLLGRRARSSVRTRRAAPPSLLAGIILRRCVPPNGFPTFHAWSFGFLSPTKSETGRSGPFGFRAHVSASAGRGRRAPRYRWHVRLFAVILGLLPFAGGQTARSILGATPPIDALVRACAFRARRFFGVAGRVRSARTGVAPLGSY